MNKELNDYIDGFTIVKVELVGTTFIYGVPNDLLAHSDKQKVLEMVSEMAPEKYLVGSRNNIAYLVDKLYEKYEENA